jgi:hypothetical protein
MAGTADTGADSEVLPAERRRLLDEHPHIREPRPSRPTNGRLPLHGGYGWFIGLVVFWVQSPNSVAYPGCLSWILIFIPSDSRIQERQQKRRGKKIFSLPFL